MRFFRSLRASLCFGAGTVSALLVALILVLPFRWVFFFIGGVWVLLLFLLMKRLSRLSTQKTPLPILAVVTACSCLALFSLVEWSPLQWFLVVASGIVAAALVWVAVGGSADVVHEHKRLRRIIAMFWTLDAYAAASVLYAIEIFFPEVPFPLLATLAGLACTGCAFMIWRLYADVSIRSNAPWVVVCFLITTEFFWAIHRLPFGYMVSGVLVTWLWYLLQLFIRFHFGPQGIVWKKQRQFLLWNAFAYLGVLTFFIRWV
jgi:hypothetical protein